MDRFKDIKASLLLIAVIVVAIFLMVNKFLVYGIVIATLAILAYLFWTRFVKSMTEKASSLEKENTVLHKEVDELRHRKLNISTIKEVLEINLLEIDTNFTRTWNDYLDDEQKIKFIGALQVEVIAKFGIDLNEIKIKYNPDYNSYLIANVAPRLLSFKDLNYEWKIAEMLVYDKSNLIRGPRWKTSKDQDRFLDERKEELRKKTHLEIKNGPEELKWIAEPLKKQIADSLEFIFGSQGRKVEIVEEFDDSFKLLEEYGK